MYPTLKAFILSSSHVLFPFWFCWCRCCSALVAKTGSGVYSERLVFADVSPDMRVHSK